MIDYLAFLIRQFFGQVFFYLTLPVRFLVGFAEGAFHFTVVWWHERDFRFLLWGLPAVLAMLGSAYLVLSAFAKSPSSRADQYLIAGQAALAGGKWPAARLYLERAWELDPGSNETLFQLATAASGEGDETRVNIVMERLAPDDRAVYAPAHQAKAEAFLQQGGGSLELVRLADRHLQHVHTLDPDNPVAHQLRGNIYFSAGSMDQAIRHLSQVADRQPDVSLMLAKAYAVTNSKGLAEHWGKQAERHFKAFSQSEPRNVDARLAWAEAAMLLGEFKQSARILQDGLALETSPPLRHALARVYAHWSDSLLADTTVEARQQRFTLLTNAITLSPSDLFLFDRVLALLRESGPDSAVREFLLDNIVAGRALPMSHLLLGTYAYEHQDPQEAQYHLGRAFHHAPQATIIANNFAWILIHNSPADPERALTIMESVLQVAPQDHLFLDTRGQAYIKLQRWEEGIADLETSLPTNHSQLQTHQALAEAYLAIGKTELAERHQSLAEQLRSRRGP